MSSSYHFQLNITAEKRASEYVKWTVFIIFVQFLVIWYLFPRIYGKERCSFMSDAFQIRRNKGRYEIIGQLSCNESAVRFSNYF